MLIDGRCHVDNEENPYKTFRLFCATFRTKEHAQMIGVLSFSLFLCLVVFSLYLFGSMAIFYITIGVVVYSFLMRSIFNHPFEKIVVLAYLIFESLQIGFMVAFIMYILMPIVFVQSQIFECNYHNLPSGEIEKNCHVSQVNDNSANKETLIQFFIFLVVLTIIKFYFTRVFTYFYKYLIWIERNETSTRTQYLNRNGARINGSDVFANNNCDGVLPQLYLTNENNEFVLNFGHLPPLPTYNQTVGSVIEKKDSSTEESAARSTQITDATTAQTTAITTTQITDAITTQLTLNSDTELQTTISEKSQGSSKLENQAKIELTAKNQLPIIPKQNALCTVIDLQQNSKNDQL